MSRGFIALFFILAGFFPVFDLTDASDLKMIGGESIWKPDEKILNDMRQKCEGDQKCLIGKMKEAGASPEAIALSRELLRTDYPFCYMKSFRDMGKVDIAEVECPFMANTMGFTLLVNGTPGIIQTGNFLYLKTVDITKDPHYRSIISRYPKAEIWFRGSFVKMETSGDGSQKFLWENEVLNGCSACEVAGKALISYDFDGTGKFQGVRFIRLKKSG